MDTKIHKNQTSSMSILKHMPPVEKFLHYMYARLNVLLKFYKTKFNVYLCSCGSGDIFGSRWTRYAMVVGSSTELSGKPVTKIHILLRYQTHSNHILEHFVCASWLSSPYSFAATRTDTGWTISSIIYALTGLFSSRQQVHDHYTCI